MMSRVLAVLGIVVVLYVLFALYAMVGQSGFVYYPDRLVAITPAALGMRFEDLRIRAADGETLAAWYVPAPAGPGAPGALTVLHCHGNGGNNANRVGLVRAFHDLGMNVLAFDYRGYGDSTGAPDEEGTYRDAEACWKYLVEARKIPPQRIIVHGQSLGGAVGSWLALKVRPGMLILESTFTSARDMAAGMFPILPARVVCRFGYDSLARMPRMKCPVLVAHSPGDEMIPYCQARRLFDAAPEPKAFVDLEGDHNAGGLEISASYRVAIREFVARHLAR
ncbi:MAG: alpha/beta hydrolase [Verrucomicrobiota bacterium]|nr:alpha/beta hydrolase [Verrucomicrobiota bacterium]